MKVVILKGSPRKKGVTNTFVNEVFKDIDCEIKEYEAYYNDIKPCIDCRYCFSHEEECVIKDEFQTMMADISEADLVVLASPLHFSTFTGKLLSMISRMQLYYAVKYHFKKPLPFKDKYALSIICGGNNYPTMFEAPELSDRIIYPHLNANKGIERLEIKKTDKFEIEELIDMYQDDIIRVRKYIEDINASV